MGEQSPKFPPDIQNTVRRKLVMLDAATSVRDLLIPPGNRLERLSGDRVGQWSIRVNDPWRIGFVWEGDGAESVELVDYH